MLLNSLKCHILIYKHWHVQYTHTSSSSSSISCENACHTVDTQIISCISSNDNLGQAEFEQGQVNNKFQVNRSQISLTTYINQHQELKLVRVIPTDLCEIQFKARRANEIQLRSAATYYKPWSSICFVPVPGIILL